MKSFIPKQYFKVYIIIENNEIINPTNVLKNLFYNIQNQFLLYLQNAV